MKICNVVAILSISCLLPILAQKQDNAIDTTGLTCENELGQCIDKNDTHQCMFPLAKLDCPAGKECCKTFPKEYDSAALPLTKAKKCTKKCPCCIARMTDTMTNVEDTLKSTQEVLDSKPSKNELQSLIESNCFDSESKLSEMTRDINGVDEKITNLESAMKGVDEKMTYLESVMKDQFKQLNCAMKGYQIYGDSCYFISSSKETWSNAQAKCVNMGGNLVKIDNDEEFSFLQGQVTHNTWIGLSDIEVEGEYTWISDGSILATQDWWQTNEPSGGGEDCVHFWDYNRQNLLNDLGCTASILYICEL